MSLYNNITMSLTPQKAQKILDDGVANEKPLTPKQKKYFNMIANSKKKLAKGGITKGKSHKEGGIPLKVKNTGQNIEVEGGEGIINKTNMADTKLHDFEGKKMTKCEIASEINSDGGNGVEIDCEGITGKKYKHEDGGRIYAEGGEVSGYIITEYDDEDKTEKVVLYDDKGNSKGSFANEKQAILYAKKIGMNPDTYADGGEIPIDWNAIKKPQVKYNESNREQYYVLYYLDEQYSDGTQMRSHVRTKYFDDYDKTIKFAKKKILGEIKYWDNGWESLIQYYNGKFRYAEGGGIEVSTDDLFIDEKTPNYKQEIIDLANKEYALDEQAMFDLYAMSNKPNDEIFNDKYEKALEFLKREDLDWIKVKEKGQTYAEGGDIDIDEFRKQNDEAYKKFVEFYISKGYDEDYFDEYPSDHKDCLFEILKRDFKTQYPQYSRFIATEYAKGGGTYGWSFEVGEEVMPYFSSFYHKITKRRTIDGINKYKIEGYDEWYKADELRPKRHYIHHAKGGQTHGGIGMGVLESGGLFGVFPDLTKKERDKIAEVYVGDKTNLQDLKKKYGGDILSMDECASCMEEYNQTKQAKNNIKSFANGGVLLNPANKDVQVLFKRNVDATIVDESGNFKFSKIYKKGKMENLVFLFKENNNVFFKIPLVRGYMKVDKDDIKIEGFDYEFGGGINPFEETTLSQNDIDILDLLRRTHTTQLTILQQQFISTFIGTNVVNSMSNSLIKKIFGLVYENKSMEVSLKTFTIINNGKGNVLSLAPIDLDKILVTDEDFTRSQELVLEDYLIKYSSMERKINRLINKSKDVNWEYDSVMRNKHYQSDAILLFHPNLNPIDTNLKSYIYLSKLPIQIGLGVAEFDSPLKMKSFYENLKRYGNKFTYKAIEINQGITDNGVNTLIYLIKKGY